MKTTELNKKETTKTLVKNVLDDVMESIKNNDLKKDKTWIDDYIWDRSKYVIRFENAYQIIKENHDIYPGHYDLSGFVLGEYQSINSLVSDLAAEIIRGFVESSMKRKGLEYYG